MPFVFTHPAWLALALVAPILVIIWNRRQPSVGHTNVSLFKKLRGQPILAVLPAVLFIGAWTISCAALARPVVPVVEQHRTIDARDIVIAMDMSGSMSSTISTGDKGCTFDPTLCQSQTQERKIDLAAAAIRYFVQHRTDDRVGLLVFDDSSYWHYPLTNDINVIIQKTYLLNQYIGGGTNFDGPNPDGYESGIGPIQAAIDHFNQYGQSRTKVLILVTDGESSISPKRFAELSAQMQALGVHMYVLGVGDDWTTANSYGTEDLRRFVRHLGGTIIAAGNASEMQSGLDQINAMEATQVVVTSRTIYRDIYRDFLIVAGVLWLSFLVLNLGTRRLT